VQEAAEMKMPIVRRAMEERRMRMRGKIQR
jgi:hypothetical protein